MVPPIPDIGPRDMDPPDPPGTDVPDPTPESAMHKPDPATCTAEMSGETFVPEGVRRLRHSGLA
jgi:hypothetical protein